jgi:hypothetical protein
LGGVGISNESKHKLRDGKMDCQQHFAAYSSLFRDMPVSLATSEILFPCNFTFS